MNEAENARLAEIAKGVIKNMNWVVASCEGRDGADVPTLIGESIGALREAEELFPD